MANMDHNGVYSPGTFQRFIDEDMVLSNLNSDSLASGKESESVNPTELTLNNAYGNSDYDDADYGNMPYNSAVYSNTNGFQAPQELVPAASLASTYNVAMGPCYHPAVGWYYPTTQLAGVPPPPPMIPMAGATPVTSVPTSAMQSAAPSRTQGKRKYGPSVFVDARAEGRNSIGNGEANYFGSSASRRDGRGDKKSSVNISFARGRKRPSIVRACICQNHAAEHVKRPKNAFIFFRQSKEDEIRKGMRTASNPAVSKAAGQMWQNSPKHIKDYFKAMAKVEEQRHAEKYPDYKYEPGKRLRAKFGDKGCTCGAYELNLAHLNEKRGHIDDEENVEDSAADDDHAYIPTTRSRATTAAPTATMQAPPDLDPYALGLPANQAAEAAATLTNLKRKHNLTVTTSREEAEEPQRKRRSPRATAGNVKYAELADDEDTFNAELEASALFGFDAPCKTPSTGKVEHFRRKSSAASNAPALMSAPSTSPAKTTRSKAPSVPSTPASAGKAKRNEVEIITADSEDEDSDPDEDDDVDNNIVIAPRKTRGSKKSSTSTQGSVLGGVNTRSQTGRRRSLRSGGR